MSVKLPNNADWDCFKTLISREILKIRIPLLEEHYAFPGSPTFVPISWMCKKQTSVSHSSTESEIISLDTGLRLDGLPALELWDLIVSVLGNLLKSGKVRLRRTIDRGNLMKLLGMKCNKFAFIMKMLFSTEMRSPSGTER